MLSILPSQRGNSELCRDAVACDGPPFLLHHLLELSASPLLLLFATFLLFSLACRTLRPRCAFAATMLAGPRAPSDALWDVPAMHRISRTPEASLGSWFRRRPRLWTPFAKPNAELTLAISRFSRIGRNGESAGIVVVSLPLLFLLSFWYIIALILGITHVFLRAKSLSTILLSLPKYIL